MMVLKGLDGANPLGFLAATGAVVVARAAGEGAACLGWRREGRWVPVLTGLTVDTPADLCELLAAALRGRTVSEEVEETRKAKQKEVDAAKKAVADRRKQIRARRLSRQARQDAEAEELAPLVEVQEAQRRELEAILREAVPRPEMVLGKRLDCNGEEYRAHASAFLAASAGTNREVVDLLAAFGTDACLDEKTGVIDPTPFCFIKGSGNQDFLDTARQLTVRATGDGVHQALFEPWTHRDQKYSMRWDPVDDKRYALVDRKPADEGVSTVWMANLLAYRGLVLFPCVPGASGLVTTGWATIDGERVFTWPIWEPPVGPDTIRALLQVPELARPRPSRLALRGRGVATVYRSRRYRYPPSGANFKVNFSPARPPTYTIDE